MFRDILLFSAGFAYWLPGLKLSMLNIRVIKQTPQKISVYNLEKIISRLFYEIVE